MACSFEVRKGSDATFDITLASCRVDDAGEPVELEYDGTEDLTAVLWDGDDGSSPLAAIPAGQISMPTPPSLVRLTIRAADIEDVSPGYAFLVVKADGSAIWERRLHVRPGPGDG